jgi:HK97 family phage portal protein
MLHFVGLSYDGVKGKSPITACREALGLGLATQKFGAKFFENGAILSGVLQTDGKLTEESAQRLRTSWNNRFGGVYKSHSTAVLEGGVNYKPISVPLVDAEFVKNRSFTISEIARIFRVQPHMIMDLERSTNNNIEQQSIEFVTYTLMPYLVNIEQEFNRKIFSPSEQKNSWVKFRVSGLLRADVDSRGDYYRRLFEIGVLSANEIREFEDLNRIQGLDEHYVPLNLGPTNNINDESK